MAWIAAPTTSMLGRAYLANALKLPTRRTTEKRTNHPDDMKLQALHKLLYHCHTTKSTWNCVRRLRKTKCIDVPRFFCSDYLLARDGWTRGSLSSSGIAKILDP